MSTSNVEKAVAVLHGIDTGDAETAATHIDVDRYVDHNPAVGDGIDGLVDFVRHLPEGQHHVEVVRAFADGDHVVTHARGNLGGHADFFDVFRFDVGSIVEHWAFSAPGGPPTRSGHTRSDGPTEPRHEQDTEKNKALVREYYETVHISGRHTEVPCYVSEDQVRHDPGARDGVVAFQRDLARITRNRAIDEIVHLLGRGDLVFITARGTVDRHPCVYVDLYRVEGDQLAEHWGFPERVPPPTTWKNAHGML